MSGARKARLDALVEEATVDCYNEADHAAGLFTMIDEHLVVPFETTVRLLRPRQPLAAWQQREHLLVLLRQHFPRSTDLRALTQRDLDAVAAELNDRPRQTPGWKSPSQALDEELR